jgi:hypothetical protein
MLMATTTGRRTTAAPSPIPPLPAPPPRPSFPAGAMQVGLFPKLPLLHTPGSSSQCGRPYSSSWLHIPIFWHAVANPAPGTLDRPGSLPSLELLPMTQIRCVTMIPALYTGRPWWHRSKRRAGFRLRLGHEQPAVPSEATSNFECVLHRCRPPGPDLSDCR